MGAAKAEQIPLICFEDEHLLVVNKPAGLNTHAPSPYAGEGLYEWLRHREPRWESLAIIHRLDKETSGVLVFSKTALANRSLTAQFSSHTVRKKYLFLTDRKVPSKPVTAISALVRSGDRYVSRPLHAGGERAETRFQVAGVAGQGTLVEAEPVTGRTHQIRVHAADQGFPVLGDALYGGTSFSRVCLHSEAITLIHPVTQVEMTFKCVFENVGKASSLPVHGASSPRVSGGRMPPELADKMSAPHFQTGSKAPVDFFGNSREALRAAIIDLRFTNAYRLIHGAADGWPGWYVDRLGDYLLSQSAQRLSSAQSGALSEWVKSYSAHGAYHKILSRDVGKTSVEQPSPAGVFGEKAPGSFPILENGVQYELSFEEGYSIGIFLDQRENRRRLLTNYVAAGFPLWAGAKSLSENVGQASSLPVHGASSPRVSGGRMPPELADRTSTPHFQTGSKPPAEVLNAFAYTCGFSVCAAVEGARTVSLDLSKKYLEWGRRNFVLNGIDPTQHEFIQGDTFDWFKRLSKKKRLFDVIILDPPTFSRSRESGLFQAEKDYGKLVAAALPLLKSDGVLFASTNAARLSAERFVELVTEAGQAVGRHFSQKHFGPQPVDFPISRGEPGYLKTLWLRLP